jgi:hypothetical protein
MEVLYESCCGIDVHKSSVAVCILLEQKHRPQKHLRRFGCTTQDLGELAEWLTNTIPALPPHGLGQTSPQIGPSRSVGAPAQLFRPIR